MNIETKYIIRWGIPGWVLIAFILIPFVLTENGREKLLGLGAINTAELLAVFLSAGFIGVPIGYLLHQLYFSINWLFRVDNKIVSLILSHLGYSFHKRKIYKGTIDLIDKKYRSEVENENFKDKIHKSYFHLDAVWQFQLLKLDESRRNYIAERYRYFLNTIHGLGALRACLVVTILTNIFMFLLVSHEETTTPDLSIYTVTTTINVILLIIVDRGFSYYSKHLNHFQGHMLNEMFNNRIGNT
jgi:hypothetical protein